jgi:di/tricarboxylate transporter
LIGLALAIALIAVFVTRDINTFDNDLGFRLIVYALWIGVPVAYLIVMKLSPLKKLRQIDERDKLIMERAPRIQWLAVVISLAAWIVVLTESYWDQGQVPVVFLTLIFISTLVVSTLAESLGILIGYWRMR